MGEASIIPAATIRGWFWGDINQQILEDGFIAEEVKISRQAQDKIYLILVIRWPNGLAFGSQHKSSIYQIGTVSKDTLKTLIPKESFSSYGRFWDWN